MGLDVGDRTVGVAVSDPLGTVAQGWTVIRRTEAAADIQVVLELARERDVGLLVVGLPRSLKGEVGPQAQKVLAFVAALQEASSIPVALWDERFTTRVAQEALRTAGAPRRKRKALVDQVAAAVILQGFLDAERAGGAVAGPRAQPPQG